MEPFTFKLIFTSDYFEGVRGFVDHDTRQADQTRILALTDLGMTKHVGVCAYMTELAYQSTENRGSRLSPALRASMMHWALLR